MHAGNGRRARRVGNLPGHALGWQTRYRMVTERRPLTRAFLCHMGPNKPDDVGRTNVARLENEMSSASKRRRATARHEAGITGTAWVPDRQRAKRAASEKKVSGYGGLLLQAAATFAARDDKARGRKQYARIDPARGDGGKVPFKQEPVMIYSESARDLLGY